MRARKVCKVVGCPEIAIRESYCKTHLSEAQGARDSKRNRSTKAYRRKSWKIARAKYLRQNPWCMICNEEADTVDHIVSLNKGGRDEPDNYQSLCRSCHSRKTAKFDGGFGNGMKG